MSLVDCNSDYIIMRSSHIMYIDDRNRAYMRSTRSMFIRQLESEPVGSTPQGLFLRCALYEIKKLRKNIIVVLHDE